MGTIFFGGQMSVRYPGNAMIHVNARSEGGFQSTALNYFLGAGVVFLVICNGFFTYSGATLYIREPLFAALFAIAVQFAIAATLLALPNVRGLGRLVMLVVYVAAFMLSTLSAFTWVYNTSHPEGVDMKAVNTKLRATVSSLASDALHAERAYIENERNLVAQAQRSMEEEALRGYNSGAGPGKGPKYYAKEETWRRMSERLTEEEQHYQEATKLYEQINTLLSQPGDDHQRENLIVLFSKLRTHTTTDEANRLLDQINTDYLGQLQNPVERAITAIVDRSKYSITMIVSVVWAAIFDLLALFIGVIRYYLLKPDRSLAQGFYDGVVDFMTFLFRIRHIGQEARFRYQEKGGARIEAVNSPEMQSFATYLLAGSQLSLKEGETDATEPLRTLSAYIEPLGLARPKNSIGIPYDTVHEETRLKTLMALLVQTGVFINDLRNQCYILSNRHDMAGKVMVFLRLGMKDQSEKLENVQFLLNPQALPPLPG